VENVVATIEIPRSHQGIFPPARKNERVSFPAFLDAQTPIAKESSK
jgi:hypothetical protein